LWGGLSPHLQQLGDRFDGDPSFPDDAVGDPLYRWVLRPGARQSGYVERLPMMGDHLPRERHIGS
jgi:hypothetical protein